VVKNKNSFWVSPFSKRHCVLKLFEKSFTKSFFKIEPDIS